MQRTPLHEEHVALGARMVDFHGWEMPMRYEGIVAEHDAVRGRAGVFDVSHMGQLRVFGPAALEGLQRALSNDASVLALGDAQYTLLLDESGGILDDLIVYRTGDWEYTVVFNAANTEVVIEALSERLSEGVELVDESARTALLAVQGPLAMGIVAELAGPGFETPARFGIGAASLDGIGVLVARTGYTGEDGVEIVCHASQAAALWRALLSFPELSPCGLGARDVLRLEMGYPLHGADITPDSDPVSAGLSWAVGWEKGDFVGRAALERIRESGPARRLVGIEMRTGVPRAGMDVLRGDRSVGTVASGTFSPSLEHGIALAWVDAEAAAVDTPLAVDVRGKARAAEVVRKPFVGETSLTTGND